MLSILIPIYNFDVRQLVAGLHRQCVAAGVAFEIVCFDDGSAEGFKKINREVSHFKNLVYKELPQNLGRSAIRNALGRAAGLPFLLFMDCDSRVVRDDFIQNYLDHIGPGALVYGGRSYSPTPPADPMLFFHWKYGAAREQSTAMQREKSPWHSFMTNNFVVPKALFLSIGFDESLTQYGHEDTLFGMELAKRKIPIIHIDNPLEHIGLEPADVFLEKTRLGLQNLKWLVEKNKPVDTTLLRAYRRVHRMGLATLVKWAFQLSRPVLEGQLKSAKPSLPLFDFYKLGYFASIK